jgi:PAS domain S-box-containing protein
LDSLKTTNEITPISVLHIDDDPSILEITKLMLENIDDNIRIEQACSVDEGLQKVSIGQYDVVVSDYEMPQKDGLKFLKELRELNNKIGFILFTGKGREEVAIQALNLGADGYINKQNNPETVYGELAHTINRVANQRNTEKTLFLERKRLELVSKNIGAGLTIISKDYHILWANKLLTDLFGEITAKTCYSTLNNQTNVCSGCGVKKIFETEAAQFVHEQKVPGADGKTAWLEITATAIKDEAGKVTSALEMAIDITERKRAEEEIKSMSRFPDENPFAILRIDKNGTLLFINPSGQKLFDHLELKVGNHVPEQWQKKVTKTLESKLRTNFEQEVNGSLFSFSATPIVSQGYVNIYAKDITENKKAEEAANADAVLRSTLLDNVPCIALVLDKKTRIIVASNKIAQEIGALPGKTCFETCAKGSFPCPFCLAPNLWATNEKQVLEEVEYNGKYYKGVWMPYTKDLYIHYIFDLTQAKKNEEKQRLSDEQFRQLFSSMPSGVAVYEAVDDGDDFVFKDFNPLAEKIENISKDNVVGKRVTEVFPGAKAFGIFSVFQRVYQSGKPEYYPDTLYKDDKDQGTWRENWVYKLPNGNIVAIYNDITDRKKAEMALKDSENKMKSIIECSSDQIFLLNKDLEYISVNKALAKVLGKVPKDIIGKSISEVYDKETAAHFSQNIKRAFEANESLFIEEKMFAQGQELIISSSLNPVEDEKGCVIAVAGIVRDITESKKAEEAMIFASKRLEFAHRAANAGVWDWNIKTDEIKWTDKMFELFGLNPKDELASFDAWESALHPQDKERAKANIVKALHNHSFLNNEYRIIMPDGEIRWINSLGEGEYDGQGNPLNMSGICIDITERKKMEETLKEKRSDIALINEKLRVVGGLTRHDVANKLLIAKSNLYLLKKSVGDNADLVKFLDGIDSALVSSDMIFEFSQLYERIGVEKPSRENVFENFNQAVALMPNLGDVLVVNETQGLLVVADSLLKQLFYNFIDNSLKHGEKVTQIRLRYIKEDDGGVKLVYEDNGVGISEANKLKLFNSGFTSGEGSGLGLYLVKKMMDVFCWTITEEGEAGEGAKFVLTIPKLNKDGKENYQIT